MAKIAGLRIQSPAKARQSASPISKATGPSPASRSITAMCSDQRGDAAPATPRYDAGHGLPEAPDREAGVDDRQDVPVVAALGVRAR